MRTIGWPEIWAIQVVTSIGACVSGWREMWWAYFCYMVIIVVNSLVALNKYMDEK